MLTTLIACVLAPAGGMAGGWRQAGAGGAGARRTSGTRGGSEEWKADFGGTRIFVENLSYDTTWTGLKSHFAQNGYPVVYASVSETPSGESKGCGLLQFETAHAAADAIERMTGSELDGRSINCRRDAQEAGRRKSNQSAPARPRAEARPDVSAKAWRSDAQELGRRPRDASSSPARPRVEEKPEADTEAWRSREWSRVPGTLDGESHVSAKDVLALLAKRDAARELKDFASADALLDELEDLGVHLDDARRQRVWWLGWRVEGEAGAQREAPARRSAAASSRGRRAWFNSAGDDTGDDSAERGWGCADTGGYGGRGTQAAGSSRGARDSARDRGSEQRDEQRPGDWACPSCGANNFARRDDCFRCGTPKGRAKRNFGPGDAW